MLCWNKKSKNGEQSFVDLALLGPNPIQFSSAGQLCYILWWRDSHYQAKETYVPLPHGCIEAALELESWVRLGIRFQKLYESRGYKKMKCTLCIKIRCVFG